MKTKKYRKKPSIRRKKYIVYGGNHETIKIDHFIERKNKDLPKEISGVPLVIYETWHTDNVPPKMSECIRKLIDMNPEFDYYLYTQEQCAKFIGDNFDKEVLNAYHTLKPAAYKADLWRYCIIYKKGGVYLDTKYTSVTPLVNIIKDNPTIFVTEKKNDICNKDMNKPSEFPYGAQNTFLISPVNNIVFKKCIDEIVLNCKLKLYQNSALHVTGPCLLGKMINIHLPNYKSHFTIHYESDESSVYYKDQCILQSYPEYRQEQKHSYTGSSNHYSLQYTRKNIYSNKV